MKFLPEKLPHKVRKNMPERRYSIGLFGKGAFKTFSERGMTDIRAQLYLGPIGGLFHQFRPGLGRASREGAQGRERLPQRPGETGDWINRFWATVRKWKPKTRWFPWAFCADREATPRKKIDTTTKGAETLSTDPLRRMRDPFRYFGWEIPEPPVRR